jgi:DNA repair protein RadC
MKDTRADYTTNQDADILARAEEILLKRLERIGSITSPMDASEFLRMRLAHLDHEEFHIMHLDQRHQIIAIECHAQGTISGATVFPREVLKSVLVHQASAVILAHGHPSGNPEPSHADIAITKTLRDALELIDVRILDHIVVGRTCVSLAERGLI